MVAAQIASVTQAINGPWQRLRRPFPKPSPPRTAGARSVNCLILAKNKMPHNPGTVDAACGEGL
jgi:hypothetical protein